MSIPMRPGDSPRGKELKWTLASVYRDGAMAQSAFRNTKLMLDILDDEHVEAQGDELRLLAARIDNDMSRIRELLQDMNVVQKEKRLLIEGKANAT